MPRLHPAAITASLLALASTGVDASCGSAFCFVNTNWSLQGIWTQPGPLVDLRFEYIEQDQLREGTGDVAVGQVPAHHDEVRTINRNLLTTLDDGFNENWGVTAIVPVVDRSHTRIHIHHGEQIVESWNFTQLDHLASRIENFDRRAAIATPCAIQRDGRPSGDPR